MVIGFNKKFVPKILAGTKTQTIRLDKNNRWKSGRVMHMATGVRTKDYNCFKMGECIGVEDIILDPEFRTITIHGITERPPIDMEDFAKKDGFDSVDEFWEWFSSPFVGKIIYWKNEK